MSKFIAAGTVAALALTAVAFQPALARDRGGAVAAGVIGGLAVGAIVGSQINRNDGYGYRDDGYRERAYYNGGCRTERQEFEDRYGRLRVRTVRVCD